MEKNVGGMDRILRILVGLIIIALGILYSSWWGLIGIVPLGTGLMNRCPLYPMLKFNTFKKKITGQN